MYVATLSLGQGFVFITACDRSWHRSHKQKEILPAEHIIDSSVYFSVSDILL